MAGLCSQGAFGKSLGCVFSLAVGLLISWLYLLNILLLALCHI